MTKRVSDGKRDGKVSLREGYQGAPLKPGAKLMPPKEPAAWVPAETPAKQEPPKQVSKT